MTILARLFGTVTVLSVNFLWLAHPLKTYLLYPEKIGELSRSSYVGGLFHGGCRLTAILSFDLSCCSYFKTPTPCTEYAFRIGLVMASN